ncbi:hypothetical protein [Streptomyces cinnamoneus]|uniref:Uncharacterized protein n=1 Tax=Streptomyces cinnamoneus TaxID=53446 RepID=A0A918TYN9_STRCJ|nr:hypothetical protein [Streptomyces cinnamoneus]GHC64865.1 hypothetical protein GCM10010507_47960 [Streptomyces cinnamoneus]
MSDDTKLKPPVVAKPQDDHVTDLPLGAAKAGDGPVTPQDDHVTGEPSLAMKDDHVTDVPAFVMKDDHVTTEKPF